MATITRKVTALTKKGHPIVSIHINSEETLEDVLSIIAAQLSTNPSRQVYLEKWVNDGRIIKCGEEE